MLKVRCEEDIVAAIDKGYLGSDSLFGIPDEDVYSVIAQEEAQWYLQRAKRIELIAKARSSGQKR
jgi:hypothetical protein